MSSPPLAAGIDVGATLAKACLLDEGGVVRAHAVQPTPQDGGAGLPAFLEDLISSLFSGMAHAGAEPDLRAVGVAVPGLVDDARGIAILSANLGWRDLPLRDLLADRWQLPVVVSNDVRAGMVGEHLLGAARGASEAAFLPLGTGLACALLTRGEVVAGSPWAGELGHVVVAPGGPACGCGRDGCLEAISSAGAIARAATAALHRPVTAEEVAALVQEGDPVAQRVWQEAVSALASALAPVVAASGCSLVIIGGGLSRSGEVLLGPLRTALKARLPEGFPTRVVAATLGARAGSVGAACLAWQLLGVQPRQLEGAT